MLGCIIYIQIDFLSWVYLLGSGQVSKLNFNALFFSLLALAVAWIAVLLLEKLMLQRGVCKNFPKYAATAEKIFKVIRVASIAFYIFELSLLFLISKLYQ